MEDTSQREKRLIKTVWCVTFYVSDIRKANEKFYQENLGLEKKNKPCGEKQATFPDSKRNIPQTALAK